VASESCAKKFLQFQTGGFHTCSRRRPQLDANGLCCAGNGAPYLPAAKNVWLRRFYWFGCRNPLMNFVGFVIGVEDRNYSVTGSAPVLLTTGRDGQPQQFGWRWAIIRTKWLRLPYVSYWGGRVEFYLGWRPASGGFGLKLVFPSGAV